MAFQVGGNDKSGPRPNVNVTPLVDIVLVLLIIFMVMTPMMTKTFWLNVPKEQDANQPPPPASAKNEPLVLTVDRAGVIRINKTVLEKSEIASRLPRMLAAKKVKVVYFDAHNDTPYGSAMEAMDLARAAGARSIALLTEPVVK
jgi:biopolymer transport protein ExbD